MLAPSDAQKCAKNNVDLQKLAKNPHAKKGNLPRGSALIRIHFNPWFFSCFKIKEIFRILISRLSVSKTFYQHVTKIVVLNKVGVYL